MAKSKTRKRTPDTVLHCPATREAFCGAEVVADFFREANVPENAIPGLLEKCGPGTAWDDWKAIANEWLKSNGGPLIIDGSYAAENKTKPKITEQAGVAARDQWFLERYEASGTETYHRPAAIHRQWQGMTPEERAKICPRYAGKITKATVEQGIKRARKRRDGKP